ncbi:MAG: hypothetical protein M3N05_04400 [Pseudomonadota bacterium]|nr:hypothetical protein [Pseudomonadota bacterium]
MRARWLKAGLAGLMALAMAQGAFAQPDGANPTCPSLATMQFGDWNKMSFTLDTSSGRRVLIADGGMAFGSSFYLNKAIEANQPVDEIVIRSPGGLVTEGIRMGFVIRKAGIPTRIPPGWWCASACSFAFLGGPVRTVNPGGVYAVHMFSKLSAQKLQSQVNEARESRGMEKLLSELAEVEQNSAEVASDENDYMIRMGASRKLLTEIMYKQKSLDVGAGDRSTLRCLTEGEMEHYNVVNVWGGAAPTEALKPSASAVRP